MFVAPPCDRRANRGANLGIVDLSRKIALERRELRALLRDEIVPLRRKIHLDRLPASLDALPDYVDDVFVGDVAAQLDLAVPHVGDGGAEHDHRPACRRLCAPR